MRLDPAILIWHTHDVLLCDPSAGGFCDSTYVIWEERWGCEASASGSCSSSTMVLRNETPCVIDAYDPLICIIYGTWTTYYTRACN